MCRYKLINSYNFDKITSAPLLNGLLHSAVGYCCIFIVAGKGRVAGSFRKLHFRPCKVPFISMKLSIYVDNIVGPKLTFS